MALRTAGATKTNERRRLGDEIRISRYNWKLPPPTSRSPASSSNLLLALSFSILSLSLFLVPSRIFFFLLSAKELLRMIDEEHGEGVPIVRRYLIRRLNVKEMEECKIVNM